VSEPGDVSELRRELRLLSEVMRDFTALLPPGTYPQGLRFEMFRQLGRVEGVASRITDRGS
jgi:hypothetical protein